MKSLIPSLLFALLALMVPLAHEASGNFTPTIRPTLTCTRFNSLNNSLDAYFGYISSHTTAVTIVN
jgi:hypothetical protein